MVVCRLPKPRMRVRFPYAALIAVVAELVYALASGASVHRDVGVRVPPAAIFINSERWPRGRRHLIRNQARGNSSGVRIPLFPAIISRNRISPVSPSAKRGFLFHGKPPHRPVPVLHKIIGIYTKNRTKAISVI